MSAQMDHERVEQAAAWRVRLTESGAARVPEFELWLAEDPRNETAWRVVQGPWRMLGEYAASSELIVQRRAALAGRPRAARGVAAAWRRLPVAVAAALAFIAVAAGAVLLFRQTHQYVVYRTGAGERRVVTLADGSQITLDMKSEVAVRYTVHFRELELEQGQARFDVAHDAERPFTVAAEGHKVVATGTAFDVDLLGRDLRVTLIEGHVVVLPASAPTRPYEPQSGNGVAAPGATAGAPEPTDWSRIVLDPGQQLLMPAAGVPRIDRVDVDRVTAWERGQVAFKNDPLSVVVARMNRYASRPIVIGDARTGDLRISGVFHEGDVDGFVNTLASYLPISAHSGPNGSIVLADAPAPTRR
ncbi:MAG: FecR domain-containing protein [Gammaproteobacteria bacterium]|nr:FecR domain-containing protein [Gammaproteobacteria bacterium]